MVGLPAGKKASSADLANAAYEDDARSVTLPKSVELELEDYMKKNFLKRGAVVGDGDCQYSSVLKVVSFIQPKWCATYAPSLRLQLARFVMSRYQEGDEKVKMIVDGMIRSEKARGKNFTMSQLLSRIEAAGTMTKQNWGDHGSLALLAEFFTVRFSVFSVNQDKDGQYTTSLLAVPDVGELTRPLLHLLHILETHYEPLLPSDEKRKFMQRLSTKVAKKTPALKTLSLKKPSPSTSPRQKSPEPKSVHEKSPCPLEEPMEIDDDPDNVDGGSPRLKKKSKSPSLTISSDAPVVEVSPTENPLPVSPPEPFSPPEKDVGRTSTPFETPKFGEERSARERSLPPHQAKRRASSTPRQSGSKDRPSLVLKLTKGLTDDNFLSSRVRGSPALLEQRRDGDDREPPPRMKTPTGGPKPTARTDVFTRHISQNNDRILRYRISSYFLDNAAAKSHHPTLVKNHIDRVALQLRSHRKEMDPMNKVLAESVKQGFCLSAALRKKVIISAPEGLLVILEEMKKRHWAQIDVAFSANSTFKLVTDVMNCASRYIAFLRDVMKTKKWRQVDAIVIVYSSKQFVDTPQFRLNVPTSYDGIMIGKLGVYYLMQLISRELKTTVLFGGIEEWYPKNLNALNLMRTNNKLIPAGQKCYRVGQAHVENFANLVEDIYTGFLEQMAVEREASVYFVNCTFVTRYYSNEDFFDPLGNPNSILRKGTSLALACGVQSLFSGYLKNVKRDVGDRHDLLVEDVEDRMLGKDGAVQERGKGGSSEKSDESVEEDVEDGVRLENVSLESISDDEGATVLDPDDRSKQNDEEN